MGVITSGGTIDNQRELEALPLGSVVVIEGGPFEIKEWGYPLSRRVANLSGSCWQLLGVFDEVVSWNHEDMLKVAGGNVIRVLWVPEMVEVPPVMVDVVEGMLIRGDAVKHLPVGSSVRLRSVGDVAYNLIVMSTTGYDRVIRNAGMSLKLDDSDMNRGIYRVIHVSEPTQISTDKVVEDAP